MNSNKPFITGAVNKTPYQIIWAGLFLGIIMQLLPVNPYVNTGVCAVIGFISFFAILLDIKNLTAVGYDAPSRWWSLVTFMYMFRRDKVMSGGKYHKASLFLVGFIIMTALGMWAGNRQNTNDFADSSCQVTNTIPSLVRQNISCIKVTDMKKIAPDWYQGEVLLSNMETYKILTHDLHNGNIEVSLH